MYRYFVSYTYYLTNGNYGTGNAFSDLDRKIRGADEIKYIENSLETQLLEMYPHLKGKPVIMWFTELDS
jgi:hypothetical protein